MVRYGWREVSLQLLGANTLFGPWQRVPDMGILACLCNSQLGLCCPTRRRHPSFEIASLHKGSLRPLYRCLTCKVQQFYGLRIGLGIASAVSETILVNYVQLYKSVSMGKYLLGMLSVSAAMFVASTGLYHFRSVHAYSQRIFLQVSQCTVLQWRMPFLYSRHPKGELS